MIVGIRHSFLSCRIFQPGALVQICFAKFLRRSILKFLQNIDLPRNFRNSKWLESRDDLHGTSNPFMTMRTLVASRDSSPISPYDRRGTPFGLTSLTKIIIPTRAEATPATCRHQPEFAGPPSPPPVPVCALSSRVHGGVPLVHIDGAHVANTAARQPRRGSKSRRERHRTIRSA